MEDIRLVTIPVTSCLLVLLSYIVLGTVLFSMWEGWNYLDGAYFCFTSLLTIGFGDFVPGKQYIYQVRLLGYNIYLHTDRVIQVHDDIDPVEAQAKMAMGTVYILLGMAIVAMCLNLMQEKIVQQLRTAMRRIGLLRPARSFG